MLTRQLARFRKTARERRKIKTQFTNQLEKLLEAADKSTTDNIYVGDKVLAGPYRFQRMLDSGKVGLEMIKTGSDRNVNPDLIWVGTSKMSAVRLYSD